MHPRLSHVHCQVVVPLPLAEENPWRRILLCEAQGLQVHLGRLTVRSARDLHSPPDTLAGSWSGTKTHEAVLVASQQSTARLHDPTIEPAPFLPPQQPAPQLSADTPLPLAKLFGAAGDAAPPSRATVLVEVLHIAPPHAGGRYGGPHQLWMCIRDASLDAADGVPTNALLTVSDLQQAMGAFIALKPGDALLVRAAAVHAGPACLSSPPVNRLCLAADADSLIMRAVPAGAVGAGRDTAGFEVPLRAVAPGPLLELLGSDAASAEGKAKQKRGAARLGHGEASPRDSWVTFEGEIICVDRPPREAFGGGGPRPPPPPPRRPPPPPPPPPLRARWQGRAAPPGAGLSRGRACRWTCARFVCASRCARCRRRTTLRRTLAGTSASDATTWATRRCLCSRRAGSRCGRARPSSLSGCAARRPCSSCFTTPARWPPRTPPARCAASTSRVSLPGGARRAAGRAAAARSLAGRAGSRTKLLCGAMGSTSTSTERNGAGAPSAAAGAAGKAVGAAAGAAG